MYSSVPLLLLTIFYSTNSATIISNEIDPKESTEALSPIYEAVDQYDTIKKLTAPSLSRKKRDNDFDDIYHRPDNYGLRQFATGLTVDGDAQAFRQSGTQMNSPLPPLTSVTTKYNATLRINLPTTIRARIDGAALDRVVLPRPTNSIERVVPTLRAALTDIKAKTNGIPYDVGHVIAYQLGGPDADYNFTPMSGTLNRGSWKVMENHIKDWVTRKRSNGGFVDMLIVIYYDTVEEFLPLSFGVNLAYYSTASVLAHSVNNLVYFNAHKEYSKDAQKAQRGRA